MTRKQKAIRSLIGGLIAMTLFFSSGLKIPVLDTRTGAYFRNAITKAGLAYATVRVINASVSIVKASSLELEPAGVGVSLAVGQALDPIDDMTERLSHVLVTAISALGVEKLVYEISISVAPCLVAVCLFLLSCLVWFENKTAAAFGKLTMGGLCFLVIARFCLPVSSVVNEFVYDRYFAAQISAADKELAMGSVALDTLKDVSIPEIDGVMGTIENSAAFLKQKSIAFKQALVYAVGNMGSIIENLLALTFLYMGLFLIQVIILPLLSFWFLLKIVNTLFDTTFFKVPHPSGAFNPGG